ncbi:glycosyltransferase family 4 protein [Actinopolymorpha alba]|uniref:glycosyltransferase family 4 protein n=1 Tax=Actinopolymorpha alba TaxID=533267 RepID=UPI0003762B3E|nr:glycosyltransferase family 4 protein [Actinopolymorpha alba]
MRVGLLSQWFDPEPGPASLPGVLAHGLARRGHEVRVVTGFPNYPAGRIMPGYTMSRRADELHGDVRVRRVALYPSHDSSSVRRLANYTSFAASALASGVSRLRGADAVWVYNSPITVALPMWYLRYVYKIPVLLHVFDMWPENIEASGFLPAGPLRRPVRNGISAWCRAMYRSAARVAYISPGEKELLLRQGVPEEKLVYIPLWSDERLIAERPVDMRSELGLSPDQIVLVYAGAMGEAQGLEALIDACALVDDPRFVCLIAGSGISEGSLRQRAEVAGVTNVRFLGRLPKERMSALMATSDAQYVSMRSTYTIPSKVQLILASARPMLAAADGDVATLVRDSGAGITARPGDASSIADGIRLLGRSGREHLRALGSQGCSYYAQTFSVASALDRVESTLRQIKDVRRSS